MFSGVCGYVFLFFKHLNILNIKTFFQTHFQTFHFFAFWKKVPLILHHELRPLLVKHQHCRFPISQKVVFSISYIHVGLYDFPSPKKRGIGKSNVQACCNHESFLNRDVSVFNAMSASRLFTISK